MVRGLQIPFVLLLLLILEASCNPQPPSQGKERQLSLQTVLLLEKLKSLSREGPQRRARSVMESNALPDSPPHERQAFVRPEDIKENFPPQQRALSHERVKRHRIGNSGAHRGCHLGTCQTQNLASLLYRIGVNTGKDESRNTADPFSYGRKRRSVPKQKPRPRRTIQWGALARRLRKT